MNHMEVNEPLSTKTSLVTCSISIKERGGNPKKTPSLKKPSFTIIRFDMEVAYGLCKTNNTLYL
jgi:hypothetical protein